MAVFANAQTANLIELIGDLVGRDFTEGMIRLGAFLTFAFGIVLSVFLEQRLHRKLKYLEIFVELGVVFLVGFFPAGLHPILAVYPIFFIAALQWCVFPGADGFTAANVFSTNNVKQTVASFTEYLMERRKNSGKSRQNGKKGAFFRRDPSLLSQRGSLRIHRKSVPGSEKHLAVHDSPAFCSPSPFHGGQETGRTPILKGAPARLPGSA